VNVALERFACLNPCDLVWQSAARLPRPPAPTMQQAGGRTRLLRKLEAFIATSFNLASFAIRLSWKPFDADTGCSQAVVQAGA
jgi:hypothetical protein